jgi:putative inorganic carbon (hco3(-)) transporter
VTGPAPIEYRLNTEELSALVVPPNDVFRLDLTSAWPFIEGGALLVALPLLTFPNRFSVVALTVLPFVWLARLIGQAHRVRAYRSDWPLAGLLLMTSVSLFASLDLKLSLPNLDGLILDFFTFSFVLTNSRSLRSRRLLAGGLCIAAVGISLLSLVGTNWSEWKLPMLSSLYGSLRHLTDAVATSVDIRRGGFNPGQVGGTLALLLPFVLALAFFERTLWKCLLQSVVSVLVLTTLSLEASRSGTLGVAFGVVLLVALRWPRLAVGLPIIAIAVSIAAELVRRSTVAVSFLTIPLVSTTGDSLAGRQEIWSRALAEISDFPITGIGLNTFPVVTDLLYPFFNTDINARVPHAHNIFLQTALDLGLPGAVSFVGVLVATAMALFRGWSSGHRAERPIIAGLSSGLLAHLVFDLLDSVTLGAQPGVLLWAMLGGAVAFGTKDQDHAQPRGLRDVAVVHWTQWSLFALACVLAIVVTLPSVSQLA